MSWLGASFADGFNSVDCVAWLSANSMGWLGTLFIGGLDNVDGVD